MAHVSDDEKDAEVDCDEEVDDEEDDADVDEEVAEEVMDEMDEDEEEEEDEENNNVETDEQVAVESVMATNLVYEANCIIKSTDDHNGNSLPAVVVTRHLDDVAPLAIVPNDDHNGSHGGRDNCLVDKDKDGEGVAEIITASPASPSSPLPSNQESEDDDVETSSLLSDLDWYLDYVQGRSSHR